MTPLRVFAACILSAATGAVLVRGDGWLLLFWAASVIVASFLGALWGRVRRLDDEWERWPRSVP